MLFWTSVIWRLSIAECSNFKLNDLENKKLRRILDKYLKLRITEIDVRSIDSDINSISYKILRSSGYSDIKATILHAHALHRQPYSIVIDEFVLFFYLKRSYLKSVKQSFYGYEKFIDEAPINDYSTGEFVFPLPHDIFYSCLDRFFTFHAQQSIQDLSKILDKPHRSLGSSGNQMPPSIKSMIINEIIQNESKIGRKYSREEIVSKVTKVLKKFIN